MRRRSRRVIAAVAAALCMASALAVASASARPPSTYRNWAQTPNNSAGVVFHPKGDYFEVWNNGGDDDIYGVSIVFNYKGVDDRWKSAGEVQAHGRSLVHRNFSEEHHIYFYIVGPDNTVSPISEFRTNGD
jgi:ABC-type sugar transport system substrate-binding protein